MKIKRFVVLVFFLGAGIASAVKTEYREDSQSKDFKAGKYEKVVISNLGRLRMGPSESTLLEDRSDVSLVFDLRKLPDGSLIAATGPEGKVLIYKNKKWETLYKSDQPYIFSLEVGRSGKIYIGTGGSKGKIIEFDPKGKKSKVIFSDKSVQYIWRMQLISDGKLLAATGPKGKLFQIDKSGSKCIFTCKQKNLLALAVGKDGSVYVGTDSGAIIYKIETKGDKFVSRALYDASQDEISALAVDREGIVYAATASGKQGRGQAKAYLTKPQGRPVPKKKVKPKSPTKSAKSAKPKTPKGKPAKPPVMGIGKLPVKAKPGKGNVVYRIDQLGFASEVFSDQVDICALTVEEGRLYLGTGPDGWIFELKPDLEEISVYAKTQACYVMAMVKTDNGEMVLGTSTPGQVIELGPELAKTGKFTSRVFDASQIAHWGMIESTLIDSTLSGCGATIQTRSSAVADPEDLGWSQWSKSFPATETIHISSPPARFIQYKINFTSEGKNSPEIDKIKIAYMKDNRSPRIKSVMVSMSKTGKTPKPPMRTVKPAAPKMYKFIWKAEDPNSDPIRYDIYLRRVGTLYWIELEKNYKQSMLQWNPRSVPDGRYELRVVASDKLANPIGMGLTSERISDEFVVDNTAPEIRDLKCRIVKADQLLIEANLVDQLSNLKSAWITINSDKDWQYIVPADEVYDSRTERIETTITLNDPSKPVMIAIKVKDRLGNVGYAWRTVAKPLTTTQAIQIKNTK